MGQCPNKKSPGVWMCALCRWAEDRQNMSGFSVTAIWYAAELGLRVPTGVRG